MLDHKFLFNQWLSGEYEKQKKKSRYRKKFIGARKYPHLDATISPYDAEQIGLLEHRISKQSIENWNFLPFIRRDQRNRRYRHKKKELVALSSPIASRNQKKYTHIKSRPIMYASHQDASLLAYISFVLTPYYEAELEKRKLMSKVIAYRRLKRKNNVHFAHNAFKFMDKHDGYTCILIDVKGFFDTIPHKQLLKTIQDLLNQKIPTDLLYILKNVTEYRYVIEDEVIKCLKANKKPYYVKDGKKGFKLCRIEDFNKLIDNKKFVRINKKGAGIPQGSPISGLLANIFLLDFDAWTVNLLEQTSFSFYQRYSDDILIVCPREEAKQLYENIKKQFKIYGLRLSSKKTEAFARDGENIKNVVAFLEPYHGSNRRNLQYLGLEWDGRQIVLRPGTLNRRFRPKDKLSKHYWAYHKMAISKVGGKAITKQFDRMRKAVKNLG
jgi:RNA-directed DNA polymerase